MQSLGFVIVSGIILTCPSSQVRGQKTANDANDKTILVPEFSIAVKLSETARRRLQAIHESILVIAYFDGDPLPGKGKDNAPMKGVFLASDERPVDANKDATFSGVKISRRDWNNLSNKDYYVTLNVFSARKSSQHNVLDCTVPSGRISTFAGKSTQVSCRLIGEQGGLPQ